MASLYMVIVGTSTLAFTLFEILLGYMYGSLLVLSDAIHGVMDAAISYTAALGLYYASRHSRSFPWGLYGAESLATLLSVSGVLAFYTYMVAIGLGSGGRPTPLWMVSPLIAGGVMTYAIYLWEKGNYERLRLEILKADYVHARIDAVLSAASAASVLASNFLSIYMAEVAAVLAVYAYIVVEFSRLARDSIRGILGSPYRDEALESAIFRVAEGLGKPLNLKIRRAGSFLVVYLLVAADPDWTLGKIHRHRARVIRRIMRISPLIVHVDVKLVPARHVARR